MGKSEEATNANLAFAYGQNKGKSEFRVQSSLTRRESSGNIKPWVRTHGYNQASLCDEEMCAKWSKDLSDIESVGFG
jgi:hypothetical protein